MTAFKVGASISIPGAIGILQNFDPKIDVYTDTRISNPQGGDSYIFYTPVYDHNASDWYNDGYSWKNHGSNMLPNKTNPRVIVSYHRAIPPKNFIPNFVPGIKWFRKRMCVLVGQKCPILISYSGNEQPFRLNSASSSPAIANFTSDSNDDNTNAIINYRNAQNLPRKHFLNGPDNENIFFLKNTPNTDFINKESPYDTPFSKTANMYRNKHLQGTKTNGGWIKPKYSCPCGSTEHSRTTHKTCPLNSKIISFDTEKDLRSVESTSHSFISTCRCGSISHTRITNNNCPLNPKNKNTAMARIHQNIIPITSTSNNTNSYPKKRNYTGNETGSEYSYTQSNSNNNQSEELFDNFEEAEYDEFTNSQVTLYSDQTSNQGTENYISHSPIQIDTTLNAPKRRRKMLNPKKLC